MAQWRKTFFSLGGPEYIQDPRDDVALELGRQLLARQQMQQGTRMDQAKLDLQRDAMGYQQQSDAQDRAMRLREITDRNAAQARQEELARQRFEEEQRQARFGEGLAGQQLGLQQTAEQRRAAEDARRLGLEQAKFDRGVVESDRGFGLSERQLAEQARRYDEDRAARVKEDQLRDQRERDKLKLQSGLEGEREAARDRRAAEQHQRQLEAINAREDADTTQRMGLAQAARDQEAQQQVAMVASEAMALPIPGDDEPEDLAVLAETVRGYFAPQQTGDPDKAGFWAPTTKQHVDLLEQAVVSSIQARFAQERAGMGKPPTNTGEWLPFGIVDKRVDELNRMEVVALAEARAAAERARAMAIDTAADMGARLRQQGAPGPMPAPGPGPAMPEVGMGAAPMPSPVAQAGGLAQTASTPPRPAAGPLRPAPVMPPPPMGGPPMPPPGGAPRQPAPLPSDLGYLNPQQLPPYPFPPPAERQGMDVLPPFFQPGRPDFDALDREAAARAAAFDAGLNGPPSMPMGFGDSIPPMSPEEFQQLQSALARSSSDEAMRANVQAAMRGEAVPPPPWLQQPQQFSPDAFLDIMRLLYPEQFDPGRAPAIQRRNARAIETDRRRRRGKGE